MKDVNARFKSDGQAKAVKLALQRKRDGLIILPTNGGKSLVFQLPAYMEKDLTTVVIIPYVALLNEMKDKCEELGLSCQVWKEDDDLTVGNHQILIIEVEHAVLPGFQ